MIPEETLRRMVNAIYAEADLYGCMVGFEGNNQSRVLHAGLTPSVNYGRVVVILEEVDLTDAGATPAPDVAVPPTAPVPPPRITNRSRLWPELVGAGVSCGLTVVSGMAVVG